MSSTYTATARLEKPAAGDYLNGWATPYDTTMDLIDSLVGGVATVSTTGGSTSLSAINGAADDGRKPFVLVSGVLASNATVTFPNVPHRYFVYNGTTGAFTLTLTTGSGTTSAMPQGYGGIVNIDASGNVSFASPPCTSLGVVHPAFVALTSAVAATYGDASHVAQFTVGANGVISAIAQIAINVATALGYTPANIAGGQVLTGGFNTIPNNLGTIANFTVSGLLGQRQYGTNNGAFTLTAPTVDSSVAILITNGGAAGVITFSGFTTGPNTGDSYTLTAGSKFILSIERINGTSTYVWKALQ